MQIQTITDPMIIKIKYHTDIPKIEKITTGDWIDLRCAKHTLIQEGEYKMIPLGISMQLPPGYEAIVAPRSSTFKNYGIILTNGIGIIDNSYNGDQDQWQFLAYCVKGNNKLMAKGGNVGFTEIRKGDRICQFRIQRIQPPILFEEVEHLGNKDRGGIGSTGVR